MGLGSELSQAQTGSQYTTQKGTSAANQVNQGLNTQQSANQSTQAGTANQQNQYTGAQLAAQDQANQMLSTVMQTGQLPAGWGLNQAAIQAATANFKNNIEPTLAAQFGAGSPVIGSQFALMNEQLIGNLSQQEFNNFNSVFGDVANIAYRPIGSTSQTTGSQSATGTNVGTNLDKSSGTSTTNQATNTSNNLVGALMGGGFTGFMGGGGFGGGGGAGSVFGGGSSGITPGGSSPWQMTHGGPW